MKIILDAREMIDRETTETYLTEQLDLPAYFGGNMDALYDCLTELTETTLLITHTSAASEYFRRALRVIRAAGRDNPDLTVKTEA